MCPYICVLIWSSWQYCPLQVYTLTLTLEHVRQCARSVRPLGFLTAAHLPLPMEGGAEVEREGDIEREDETQPSTAGSKDVSTAGSKDVWNGGSKDVWNGAERDDELGEEEGGEAMAEAAVCREEKREVLPLLGTRLDQSKLALWLGHERLGPSVVACERADEVVAVVCTGHGDVALYVALYVSLHVSLYVSSYVSLYVSYNTHTHTLSLN